MNTVARVLLLACSISFAGCRKDGQLSREQAPDTEPPSIIETEDLATTEKAPEKGELRDSQLLKEAPREGTPGIIKVENLTVEEKTLALDYQVTNPFPYDIWICEDIDTKGRYDVETRIDRETVLIKLKFKLNCNIFRDPPAIGQYLCLPPGDSHWGRVVLELPIRNASPVCEFHERGKSRTQVVLQRAVLEIGYFDGAFVDKVAEGIEKRKRDPALRKTLIQPRIVEEEEDGRSRRFLRPRHTWPGILREKSAEVIITDVNIPCSVVVDDKKRAEQGTIEWR